MQNALVERLFSALNRHDHEAMAACYTSSATFRDIAFNLRGRHQIHAMWHMICLSDIRCTFEVLESTDQSAVVKLLDDYTFSATKKPVHNVIHSRLRFQDGFIVDHVDECDSRVWGTMAWGDALGFVFGRSYFARHALAHIKLWIFKLKTREYRGVIRP